MVVKKKRRANGVNEYYYEEEYEPGFNQASDNSDKSLLLFGGLAGLSAITAVMGSLTTTELETIQSSSTLTEAGNYSNIVNFLEENVPSINDNIQLIQDAEHLSETELTHLNQMMEEARQYSRMADPKTGENITFRNQSNIADQIGQFGYHEAGVQGNLDAAAMEGIYFPWTTCEDNGNCDSDTPPCEDCEDLKSGGPYPANNFPESPHYYDRCNEPMADPIILLSGDIEDWRETVDMSGVDDSFTQVANKKLRLFFKKTMFHFMKLFRLGK
jgi:hypothetical protein